MPSIDQWLSAWAGLSVREHDSLKDLYRQLISQYQAPSRSYHNTQHVDDCLCCFADLRAHAEHAAEIEVAIWFHDAIYDPKHKNNEELCAQWSRREAIRMGVANEAAERIYSLVLSTKHDAAPTSNDAKILVDLDLAILGSDPIRFDLYERQIREEYSWVPGFLFRRKRRQILNGLLDRRYIYSTLLFRERYEEAARENLRRSLSKL